MEKEILKKAREIAEEMGQKWCFSKYCSICGETFGSNDIGKFLKMVEEHDKKGGKYVNRSGKV